MSVGLDIGTKTIKVVELGQEGGKFVLKAAGAVGYKGTPIDIKLQDEKEMANIAASIKKLFNDARVSSRSVSIALPETQVFTRLLKFPLLNDQEIASAVKWEAEEYIPIPIKDAVVEHQVIERQETGNPPQALILLTAVLRELVEKYVQVLNLAGLNVSSIETELMSMVRSLSVPGATVMIIDFGAKSTDIAIAKDEQLYFSRSIPTAGDAFTRAVAQALGVTPQQAEEYKRTYGLAQNQLEGKVGQSLLPIFKVVAEEVKKAIHYYTLDVKSEGPTTVIISGGTAGLPGAAPVLSDLLGLEVTIGTPFSKIMVDADSAKGLAKYAPLYS